MKNHYVKWGIHFDLANKKLRVEELELLLEAPNFWDDPEKSAAVMKELTSLKATIKSYEELESAYEDIQTLLQMGYEENDASLIPEIEDELKQFIDSYETLRITTLLSDGVL